MIKGGNLIAAITGGVFYEATVYGVDTPEDLLLDSPAYILMSYIVGVLELMTLPSEEDDWPLYVSHLPDGINNSGCLYDTSGISDGRLMDTGKMIEHHGIQLTIRSDDYSIGRAKAEEIALSLDAVFNDAVDIGDEEFEIQNVKRMSNVISLGLEEDSRRNYLFTVDFVATLKRM